MPQNKLSLVWAWVLLHWGCPASLRLLLTAVPQAAAGVRRGPTGTPTAHNSAVSPRWAPRTLHRSLRHRGSAASGSGSAALEWIRQVCILLFIITLVERNSPGRGIVFATFIDQCEVLSQGAASAWYSSAEVAPPGTQLLAKSWTARMGRCELFHTTIEENQLSALSSGTLTSPFFIRELTALHGFCVWGPYLFMELVLFHHLAHILYDLLDQWSSCQMSTELVHATSLSRWSLHKRSSRWKDNFSFTVCEQRPL